ncbi:hypothetical protein ANN_10729 [Periplaneta americana]|uniref:Uncharacterized protein n=1 Tax=Periplaneta americana TaxID=6978 RepID=A0ABQ8T4Q8_PERAM|nr:hypothetical protein ANN_10729 [Periplaneta americana]
MATSANLKSGTTWALAITTWDRRMGKRKNGRQRSRLKDIFKKNQSSKLQNWKEGGQFEIICSVISAIYKDCENNLKIETPLHSSQVMVSAIRVVKMADTGKRLLLQGEIMSPNEEPLFTEDAKSGSEYEPSTLNERKREKDYEETRKRESEKTKQALQANYQVSGLQPLWFHACNVLLHATASLLFTRVCLAVAGLQPNFAGAAGLLFAAHPIHTEAVTIFKSNNENLESMFATDGTGRDIFRACLSMKIMMILLICLRFDDPADREERKRRIKLLLFLAFPTDGAKFARMLHCWSSHFCR